MQEGISPRLVQLSQGDCRLHFSLRCRQGAQDKGMRFRLRTTRNWSGEAPEFEVCADEGVGVIVSGFSRGFLLERWFGRQVRISKVAPPVVQEMRRRRTMRHCGAA